MCTSIAKQLDRFFFGRNMDLSYDFGQRVVTVPRGFPLRFRRSDAPQEHHALMGMARVQDGYPLFADGFNEHGLCMAGLNFPQSAYYFVDNVPGTAGVASFEMIPWVLGQCASVDEAEALLRRTRVIDLAFAPDTPPSPLHWHVADRTRSIAVEPMADGLCVHANPVGVMTNEPPLPFHLTNLRQYMRLTPDQPACRFPGADLSPFGWGFGGLGLPGDTSTASRFVRAAFYAACSPAEGGAVQFFHLLDTVAMPLGSVRDDRGYEITRYACCMDPAARTYAFRTYHDPRIRTIGMGTTEGVDLREAAF